LARVAFSPDSKLLATTEAGLLRLWDLANTKQLRTFDAGKLEERVAYSIAFSRDGKTLASAEGPALKTTVVMLWDVDTGKHVKTLEGHTKRLLDVAFSPDGKTLASAGGDGQVKLWDLESGKERAVLHTQTSGRHALAFSPDGKMLATTERNTVRIWDVKAVDERVILKHAARVWSVAFARDGQTLVTAATMRSASGWSKRSSPVCASPHFQIRVRDSEHRVWVCLCLQCNESADGAGAEAQCVSGGAMQSFPPPCC
jgi:WD40 repeat protein